MGKSCILLQFTENKFRNQHELTIGVEFGSKTTELNGKLVKIQIWDTAGQEAFQAITRTYYKAAQGVLLVYDITRKDTFNHLKKWLNEIRTNSSKSITIILIGNKKDMEDKYILFFVLLFFFILFTLFFFNFLGDKFLMKKEKILLRKMV